MAATLVQSATNSSSASNVTSFSCSFASTPTPGNSIVVAIGGEQAFGNDATFSDNQSGNSYTRIKQQSGSSLLSSAAASANVAATGTFTVTAAINSSGINNPFMVIQEWAGMPSTVQVDGSSQQTGNISGGVEPCGTLTTANANDVLFTFVSSSANSTEDFTAPSGYTKDHEKTTRIGGAFAHEIVSATVSAAVTWTTTDATGQWNGIAVALQQASVNQTVTVTAGIDPGATGTPYIQATIDLAGIASPGTGTPSVHGSVQTVTVTAGISPGATGAPAIGGGPQTLILQNKGIAAGSIGTPVVGDGNTQQRILIGGVDRTVYLAETGAQATSGGPVRISKQLGQPAIATFTLHMASLVFRPTPDDSVEIYDGGYLWFRGQISAVTEALQMGTAAQYEFSCTCTDQSIVATRRFVTQTYGIAGSIYYLSLRDVVLDIVAHYLSGEGITTNHVGTLAGFGPGIPLVFDGVSVQDAFNTVAAAGGHNYNWYIDQFNDLHFGPAGDATAAGPPPFSIGTGDRKYRNLTVQATRALYRNVQYVRSDQFLIQGARTETFTSANWINDGTFLDVLTKFAILAKPIIKVNGVAIDPANVFNVLTDPNGFNLGWCWAPQANAISVKLSIYTPAGGDVITVLYNGYVSNVIVEQNDSEIAARQASGGGSGRYEAIEDVKGADLAQATAIANALLAQYASGGYPKIVSFETDYPGLDLNMLLPINLPEHNINTTYLVQQINAASLDGQDLGHGTSFRSQITLVSTQNQGDWVTWFEALLARVAQGQPAAVYETCTFILGPGGSLSTGTNGANPYVVKQAGQISFIKVIAGGAPSADIFRCDILHSVAGLANQKSIFAAGKYVEIPVGSTDLLTFGPSILSPTPYHLQPDDILLPSVLIDQGSSVTLLIGWQTNGPPVVTL